MYSFKSCRQYGLLFYYILSVYKDVLRDVSYILEKKKTGEMLITNNSDFE